MSKPGKTKRPVDGDTLFEAAMRDARPLKGRPAPPPRKAPAAKAPPAIGGAKTRPPPRPKAARLPAPPTATPAGGLDKRTAERLRRGQLSIEGRLDLHGHTQADAHRAVHAFVSAGYRAGRRCLLVITGKGGPREDLDSGFMPDRDSGVLRRNLPRWLAEAPVRQMVLRLEPARPHHGGEGAYYVLLRRKR